MWNVGDDAERRMSSQLKLSRRGVLGAGLAAMGVMAAGRVYAAGSSASEELRITDELVKAAQAEGELLVRHGEPLEFWPTYTTGFTRKYGIQVTGDRKVGLQGTQAFAAEERAGRHIVDIVMSVDYPGLLNMTEEGWYQRHTMPDIDPRLVPGAAFDDIGYGHKLTRIVVQYNPSRLPTPEAEELLSTWRGLLDPRLADGRLGLTEPGGGGTPYSTYLMLSELPEYGPDFLAEIEKQKPKVYPASAPGREDLAAGATSVFAPNWEQIALTNWETGDKTRWTYPERVPAFPSSFTAISTHAPHPNAARLWALYMMSDEFAADIMATGAVPTLKDVEDKREVIARVAETDWWKPYPVERAWAPDIKRWIESYDTLLPKMRQQLGWAG